MGPVWAGGPMVDLARYVLLSVAFLTPLAAAAQESRGSLQGRVADESGGALPGVAVAATHLATGVAGATVTNGQGQYQLPLLSPGLYKIVFELQGFRRVERDRVEVRVAEQIVVDATMK